MPPYSITAGEVMSETTPLLGAAAALTSEIHIPQNDNKASVSGEVKVLLTYLLPIVFTQFLEFSLFVTTIVSVGHLGVTELAAASLAVMTSNLVALSLIQGVATALDTLCPQAYAGERPQDTSLHAMRTGVVLLGMLGPMAYCFWKSEGVLLALRQEEEVARLAGVYLRIMILALPGYAAFECLRRWLQAQGRFGVLLITLGVAATLNVALNYLLVWGPDPIRLGFIGAPIATVVSVNSMCVVTLIYSIWFCPHEAWGGLSTAIFHDLGDNIRLGLAGTAMIASEWWCWEIFSLAASYLGPTALGAQSVLGSTQGVMFQSQYALSVAVSIRVGNLLGAQRPHVARAASIASLLIVTVMATGSFTLLLVFRRTWATLFSNDAEVGRMAEAVIPLLALFQLTDGITTANNGVLRGAGRSALGAMINLLGYYILALPIGLVLAFVPPFNLGLRGIWTGISVAIGVTATMSSYFLWKMDWEKEARIARERGRTKGIMEETNCED